MAWCVRSATVVAVVGLALVPTARAQSQFVPKKPAAGLGQGAAKPGARSPTGGAAPPAARQLTPAEIGALQTMMTDRAINSQLTPANAEAIRNRMMDTQGAAPVQGTLDRVQPRPRSLDVDPQVLLSTPETIQLALGVVTPLTFLDSNGRPWPVEAVAFDPRMFAQDGAGCGAPPPQGAVSGAGERPSTITLMPCRINTWGNVSIKLEGYALPVVLMAKSGGNAPVDLPVTLHVRGRSPTAPMLPAEAAAAYTPPPIRYASTHGRRGGGGMSPDRFLDTFGAGAPPASAQRVDINDPAVSGWIFNGKLYLRGAITVINPAQDAVAESVGGMKVWRFDHPVPRVLVIDETGAERDLSLSF